MSSTPENAISILSVIAEHDLHSDIWWSCNGEYAPITIWVNVNDIFCWACADSEEITTDNLGQLEQAIKDCEAVYEFGGCYASMLFVSRIRKIRIQRAAYPKNKDLWPLFDACGPEREVDFGNPCKPGEYK